jgi:hypothetical protein
MTRPFRPFTAAERFAARQKAAELYAAGCTIRSVAAQIGRPYTTTRDLLVDAGVTLRARGGGLRKATA